MRKAGIIVVLFGIAMCLVSFLMSRGLGQPGQITFFQRLSDMELVLHEGPAVDKIERLDLGKSSAYESNESLAQVGIKIGTNGSKYFEMKRVVYPDKISIRTKTCLTVGGLVFLIGLGMLFSGGPKSELSGKP